MFKQFEVRWDEVLPGEPQQVWDAVTRRAGAWIWPIEYEPRVGGAERGLTPRGGTVTAWEPPRHFQTRAEHTDGWHNTLDYTLEPHRDGTLVRFAHTSMTSDYATEYDACVQHTAFYRHSLSQYVEHFAGRDATYVELDVPGSLTDVARRMGIEDAAVPGDQVMLVSGDAATIDFRLPAFLGARTEHALVRVYDRAAWGGGVSVALHLFAGDADATEAQRAWGTWLTATSEAVA